MKQAHHHVSRGMKNGSAYLDMLCQTEAHFKLDTDNSKRMKTLQNERHVAFLICKCDYWRHTSEHRNACVLIVYSIAALLEINQCYHPVKASRYSGLPIFAHPKQSMDF